jgi:hypothetical protein
MFTKKPEAGDSVTTTYGAKSPFQKNHSDFAPMTCERIMVSPGMA